MVVSSAVGGLVHRIVVESFVGKIPNGMEVNHINGIKTDNRLVNLEIVTRSENLKHAYKLGLICTQGERNSQAKLSESDVFSMYDMFRLGHNNAKVAKMFGVHDRYVSLIRHGKRWKHIYPHAMPKSFNYVYPPEILIAAKNMLDTHKNLEISAATGIERSAISRLRSGNLYKEFFRECANWLATTIESQPHTKK